MDGLQFKTVQVDDNSMISLAHKDGKWFINSVRGDLETKMAFTDKAFDSLMELKAQITADSN